MQCILEVLTISRNDLQINEEIRDKEVRLVGSDGEQLGIMSGTDARRIAAERELDLVKIAPQAKPPVCRIMDYGKHKFEQAKREKEARKNQKTVDVKEVRLSLNIDQHDFDTKLRHAIRFLESGDKIKVSLRFRGREMAHSSQGNTIMKRFAEAVQEHGTVDRLPKLEGRSMIMYVTSNHPVKPSGGKQQKAAQQESQD